jgi:hypothetical protein
MKRQLTSVILLIFILVPIFGQSKKDVLYLKNGSTIYGKLIEASDSQYKIRTADGSIFIFASPEVDKFVNERPYYEGRKKKGLGIAMEGGFLVGPQSSEYKNPFSFNIIGNVTLHTRSIFGIGSGVEYLGKPFNPIFIEYKYLISERKSTPFLFIRGGKLLYLKDDETDSDYPYQQYNYRKSYKGGASFTVGTGISWANDDGEIYLSFAYRYAHTSYQIENYNNQTDTYNNSYNRLEVKLGFKF